MSTTAITVIAALVVAWCVLSRRLGRWDLTAPMVFLAAGALLGGPSVLDLQLTSSSLELIAEVTLVFILFSDASRVDLSSLRHDLALPVRLLGVGLPLTLLLGTAVATLLPSVGWGEALLVAACLTPTDAGLGAGLVADPRIPLRVRRNLNVESGLNDGIVAPVVAVAIAALAGESAHESGFVVTAIRELGSGAAVGAAVGLIGGWALVTAARRRWSEPATVHLASVALALGAYFGAVTIHGNGFVAAFVAGLCFGPFSARLDQALDLDESIGQLLSSVVWFCFGAVMLRPAVDGVSWQVLAYAVASLTVVRMAPVALALAGSGCDRRTTAFIGWFGPRGLASVIFALIAYDQLGTASGPLVSVVSWTVLLSVLAHGLSAAPLVERYAAAE